MVAVRDGKAFWNDFRSFIWLKYFDKNGFLLLPQKYLSNPSCCRRCNNTPRLTSANVKLSQHSHCFDSSKNEKTRTHTFYVFCFKNTNSFKQQPFQVLIRINKFIPDKFWIFLHFESVGHYPGLSRKCIGKKGDWNREGDILTQISSTDLSADQFNSFWVNLFVLRTWNGAVSKLTGLLLQMSFNFD